MNSQVIEMLADRCRKKFDDNQTKMGMAIGVDQAVLSKMLRGLVKNPYRSTAKAIASYLNIPIEQVYEEGEVAPSIPSDLLTLAQKLKAIGRYEDWFDWGEFLLAKGPRGGPQDAQGVDCGGTMSDRRKPSIDRMGGKG